MITFAELTNQVHLVKDLILADMICGTGDKAKDQELQFSKHLLTTKTWFTKISWANKKRYILALLEDVRSAWTLSCLLKSIWNCQCKDAVHSAYGYQPWSSYDRAPMDHNRTAFPVATLAQVMKNDRYWFLQLEPQAQATVLLELLSLSGGPVMMAVLKRAQALYEKYRTDLLQNLQECLVVNDAPVEKEAPVPMEKSTKKESAKSNNNANANEPASDRRTSLVPGQAQKELEANLAIWNSTTKAMRDILKLEELDMTFKDGTKQYIWKVNRPKPESIETECYFQLLPSEVAKKILSYLPRAQLGDYARVNKYWAYLIDDYRVELAAQLKLEADFEKLQEMMLRHDLSIDVIEQCSQTRYTSFGNPSTMPSNRTRRQQATSLRASEKSTGAYSFRHLVGADKLSKPILAMKPIRKLVELSDRLERRGAADENLWQWCENILKNHKYRKAKRSVEGVLPHDNVHFPYLVMKETLDVPLHPPLCKDPATNTEVKLKRNISTAALQPLPKKQVVKRFSLWSKDFSCLYPVCKIPSHASPI